MLPVADSIRGVVAKDETRRQSDDLRELVLAKSFCPAQSDMDFFVIPRLKRIVLKENISHAPLREKMEELLTQCDALKPLPLALCHIDLNARNVSQFSLPAVMERTFRSFADLT